MNITRLTFDESLRLDADEELTLEWVEPIVEPGEEKTVMVWAFTHRDNVRTSGKLMAGTVRNVTEL